MLSFLLTTFQPVRRILRRLRPRIVISSILLCSLLVGSCGPNGGEPPASFRAKAVVRELEAITDPEKRAVASVFALNTFCSLSRVASGISNGRVENQLKSYFATVKPETLFQIQKMGDTLRAVPNAKRTALLGKFAAFDPGACTAAPQWEAIRSEIIFSQLQPPRLRADFCAGNFNYGDGASGDRAITVASRIIQKGGPELGPDKVAPDASPLILGVEGEHVTARHPKLAATKTNPIGDGISPFGVLTDIPCTSEAGCDSGLGLVCDAKLFSGPTGKCVAYPVVQKDQDLVMRGYNFWDIESARLVFTPLFPGEGSEATTIVGQVDPNEPTTAAAACPPASGTNPTHNRAHFRVTANEGAFYKLRLYNHNGTFLTQRDAIDNQPPRVLHVCYPPAADPIDVPADTIRACTRPNETCVQDGARCVSTWTMPPRKLADCRHLLGAPIACGETPEWFANEPLSRRPEPEPTTPDDPVVFVMKDEPVYEFRASLQAVECKEETGWDLTGSDEPMVLVAGFPTAVPPGADADLISNIDEIGNTWRGGDYDSGDRKQEVKLLSRIDGLSFDSRVIYVVLLAEDDGFLGGYLAGAAVIIGAALIIYATGGAGLLGALGGAALGVGMWAIVMSALDDSDPLGRNTLVVTPLAIEQRIGATHSPDFLTTSPPLFEALPAVEEGPTEGQVDARLIHPFADFRLNKTLDPECDPGNPACPGGKVCLVNRCVEAGFVDPTAGRGFRERREFKMNGGHYGIDLLWEKVNVGP
jgi:hypothetical protein